MWWYSIDVKKLQFKQFNPYIIDLNLNDFYSYKK